MVRIDATVLRSPRKTAPQAIARERTNEAYITVNKKWTDAKDARFSGPYPCNQAGKEAYSGDYQQCHFKDFDNPL